MKNLLALAFAGICLIFASETRSAVEFLPGVPAGVEALSLMGASLISPAADAATIEKFEAAQEDYDRDPMAAIRQMQRSLTASLTGSITMTIGSHPMPCWQAFWQGAAGPLLVS